MTRHALLTGLVFLAVVAVAADAAGQDDVWDWGYEPSYGSAARNERDDWLRGYNQGRATSGSPYGTYGRSLMDDGAGNGSGRSLMGGGCAAGSSLLAGGC